MGPRGEEGAGTSIAWNPDLHQLESHLPAQWMAAESGEMFRATKEG